VDSEFALEPNRSTRIEDLERSLFAQWSEEKDDDPPIEIEEKNSSTTTAAAATTVITCCNGEDSDSDSVDEEIEELCQVCPSSSVETSSSSAPSSSKPKRYKSTDNDMKRYAFEMSRMGMASCNPTVCKLGGRCIQKTTIEDMRQMVTDFWGEFEDGAPSSKTRRLLLIEICRAAHRADLGEFHFYAGNKTHNNTRVCEAAYLILLGLSNHPNASAAPGQWINAKDYILSGKEKAGIPYSTKAEELLLKAETKSTKLKSATTFIEFFAKEFGDTIPGPEGNI
jgi:hypothetical protein